MFEEFELLSQGHVHVDTEMSNEPKIVLRQYGFHHHQHVCCTKLFPKTEMETGFLRIERMTKIVGQ